MSETFVAPPGWQPPPVRPALSPRQKSGARLAGILGFLLLSLGFAMVALPIAALAFGAFFTLIIGFIRRASPDDREVEQFLSGFEALNPTAWILPLAIVAVLGLAVMATALLTSARILRTHNVERPWAVTWAGAGIAIVASWMLSGLGMVPFSFSGGMRSDDAAGSIGLVIVVASLSLLFSLAVSAVIGWMSWWWMAHTFRRPAPAP